MTHSRVVSFKDALLEVHEQILKNNQDSVVMGLGVTDPKAIFGTVKGLVEKFGPSRVIETPTAENASTGVAIGASLVGVTPIVVYQRVEFALLAIEQIVNQAAKWSYMTDGQQSVGVVFRMIIGRGWGQGPQHSQSLESWFANIPGLTVVAPCFPRDAKGLMAAAVSSGRPVVYLEHRWLHESLGAVEQGYYETELGKANVQKAGSEVTIVAYSYAVLEALWAAEICERHGVSVEVLDLRTLRPIDYNALFSSVNRTGRLITIDIGWKSCGIGSEIVSAISENPNITLRSRPVRLGLKDVPIPSTRALANLVYPGVKDIISAIGKVLERDVQSILQEAPDVSDVPNQDFRGPF